MLLLLLSPLAARKKKKQSLLHLLLWEGLVDNRFIAEHTRGFATLRDRVRGFTVGEVARLDPTSFGYDMVIMRDLRPGRTGLRDIPYIKEWFQLVDLPGRRIEVDPPEGLLDLDRMD